LLHGVASEELDEYFSDLLGPPVTKHTFVAQIPGLPLYGAMASADAPQPEYGINAAVNVFFDRFADRRALEAWLEGECARIAAIGGARDAFVVTFAGSGSLEGEAFDEGVFAAEHALIACACEIFREESVAVTLLYAPHPMFDADAFEHLELFRTNGVIVCPQTILTWLVSDAYLAIHSSTLFEAAWCGAAVFSPLRASERIYPALLLDRLHHPRDDENRKDALRGFIRSLRAPAGDTLTRARRRVSQLVSL
jgi:hypothetical protein